MGYLVFLCPMKKSIVLLICFAACFVACNNGNNNYTPPAAGTIVASDSMRMEDTLNHSMFAVTIKTGENSKNGVYLVAASSGKNIADGGFTMPKNGEKIKPELRKGSIPYTYIVGFHINNDTTFLKYFLVSSNHDSLRMEYIQSITLQ